MITADWASFEQKDRRRYVRRGAQRCSVRVYDLPIDQAPVLPRDGMYFPGETSGPRIVRDGVSIDPERIAGKLTMIRATVVAGYAGYEGCVVILKTVVPVPECRGFYSPDGVVEESVDILRRIDGNYRVYMHADGQYRIEAVPPDAATIYWKGADGTLAGDYTAEGAGAAETVTVEALPLGGEESFDYGW